MAASLFTLTPEQQQTLLWLAGTAIEQGVCHQQPWQPSLKVNDPALNELGCSFVTLHQLRGHNPEDRNESSDLSLRGCIGGLSATQPLWRDVMGHAYDAAVHDPRFPKVSVQELASLLVEVSVLSPLQPAETNAFVPLCHILRPNIDGVVLQQGHRRAVFLPQVWEQLTEPAEFLTALLQKGGWPPGLWPSEISVECFQVCHFQAPLPETLTLPHHGVVVA
jgi:AmmeMemoRadiSam system protein A